MPHPITPLDVFTTTLVVPDNLDSAIQRATDVEAGVQALGNRTEYLKNHSAQTDTQNTFTAAPLTIDTNAADVPLVKVNKSAHNHPGAPANRWKLLNDYTMSDGRHVREYSGEGTSSCWCRTENAVWNPAAGSQNWSKDNTSSESNILAMFYGELHYYGRQPGAGSWSDSQWADQARGNASFGDTVASRAVTTTGPATIGDGLTVTTGTTALGGNLDVTGNADVMGGDMRVFGEYRYFGTAKSRTISLSLSTMWSDSAGLTASAGTLLIGPGQTAHMPVIVPNGAVMKNVRVKASSAGCTYVASIYRKHGVNITDGSFSIHDQVATTGAVVVSGPIVAQNINLSYANLVASSLESYNLVLQCNAGSANNLIVDAVQFTYDQSLLTNAGSF